jgi:hypothetical protein
MDRVQASSLLHALEVERVMFGRLYSFQEASCRPDENACVDGSLCGQITDNFRSIAIAEFFFGITQICAAGSRCLSSCTIDGASRLAAVLHSWRILVSCSELKSDGLLTNILYNGGTLLA